jgi:hypothetical protein
MESSNYAARSMTVDEEAKVRELLTRARSVLRTLSSETTLEAIRDPYRAPVIKRLMDDITDFVDGRYF